MQNVSNVRCSLRMRFSSSGGHLMKLAWLWHLIWVAERTTEGQSEEVSGEIIELDQVSLGHCGCCRTASASSSHCQCSCYWRLRFYHFCYILLSGTYPNCLPSLWLCMQCIKIFVGCGFLMKITFSYYTDYPNQWGGANSGCGKSVKVILNFFTPWN